MNTLKCVQCDKLTCFSFLICYIRDPLRKCFILSSVRYQFNTFQYYRLQIFIKVLVKITLITKIKCNPEC